MFSQRLEFVIQSISPRRVVPGRIEGPEAWNTSCLRPPFYVDPRAGDQARERASESQAVYDCTNLHDKAKICSLTWLLGILVGPVLVLGVCSIAAVAAAAARRLLVSRVLVDQALACRA